MQKNMERNIGRCINTIMLEPQQKMQKATLKCISFFSLQQSFEKRMEIENNFGYIEMSEP
jgi:hypothetical protein